MRKGLILITVLALAVLVALPASAFRIEGAKDTKFYLGGIAITDIGLWHMDNAVARVSGYPNNKSDVDQFILTVPRNSRLRTSVQSGNVGAYWELGMGRDLVAGHEQADGASTLQGQRTNFIETRKIYGWYTFGNMTLMAGKNDGSFYVAFPYQVFGQENNNHNTAKGWGTIYDDRSAQIRFTQNVSKMFSYQVSLVQPFVTDVNEPVTNRNFDSVGKYPRVDALVTLDFGAVSLMPGGSWSVLKWDDNPPGFDDSITVWMAQLPVKVKAGSFTFLGQIGYGQNVGFFPSTNRFWLPGRQAGKVKNTTGLFGFVDFSYTFGTVTPHAYFGYDGPENTDVYVGDKKNERLMYGISASWKVIDNFFIVPEFTMYDYGKNPTVAGNPDLGKEWLGGIQFQFVF